MNIWIFKLSAFIAVFITGWIGSSLALRLGSLPGSKRAFSLGNAFAGGIFLGAGLIHMLPDAQQGFRAFFGSYNFPWVSLICACGFLLVLFLEKVFTSGHEELVICEKQHEHGRFSPYILTLVLSVHSIIAGIALGTEDVIKKAVIILLAIIAHKGSAAFAVTVNLSRAEVPIPKLKKIVAFFSLMTPLGIILGLILTTLLEGRAELIVEGVFDALAAGTFLYVALIDVIEEEFITPKDKGFKFILVAFGLGIMAVLALFL